MAKGNGDWRKNPLVKYPTVQRWLNEKVDLKDSYKYRCLDALGRYCAFRKLTPDQLVRECTKSSRLNPPANLRPKDMLMEWRSGVTKDGSIKLFWGANLLRRVLPFFEANGYVIKLNAGFPKAPARESAFRITQPVTRKVADAAYGRAHKWAIVCMAESGMRPGSVVALRYKHIMDGLDRGMTPLPILVPGKITKTGQSYVAFVLEDAVRILRSMLPRNPGPDHLIVPFTASRLEHHVSEISVMLKINPPTGLKPFTCGSFREYVQNRLESAGVVHNRVSLLMGARPQGRDAHYTNPPPEELAADYMRAADRLRVYPVAAGSRRAKHRAR